MAKASKKISDKTVNASEDEVDFNDATIIDSELDNLDFELDTEDLEARIAEVSEEIIADMPEAEETSLPSERVSSAAESLDNDLPESQTPPLPANDEHNSEINDLLYSISNKPRSSVFPLAFVFTLVWLAGCAFVGYQTVYKTLPASFDAQQIASNYPLMIFAAGVLISLMVIWSCAILIKRSHDMRYSTNLMLTAAKQLLQPESIAIDSVTSVGTAVRREVAAIGEGVERAIARAGELEFMVQNEVMNIERSYGDSELKLRKLVGEISSEREEIVLHADKLQEAINNTHTTLANELETVATRIDETVRTTTEVQSKAMSESVVSAGQVVAKLLETRTASFQKASTAIEEKLDAGKLVFEKTVETKTADISSVLNNASQSVSSILTSGTSVLAEKSNELVDAIDVVQQNMLNKVISQSESATKNLEDSLSIRATEFSDRITDSGDIIQSGISEKLMQIDNSMTTVGEKLVSSLGMRAEELDQLLNSRSDQISETMEIRISGFDDKLKEHVGTSISRMGETASSLLDNASKAEKIITARSEAVEEALKKSTIEFAKGVSDNLDTIKTHAEQIGSALGNSNEQLSSIVQKGTENLQNTISTLEANAKDASMNVENTLSSALSNMNEATTSLEGKLSSALNNMDEATTNLEGKLSNTVNNVNEAINNSLTAVERQFAAGNEILETKLTGGKSDLMGTISKAVAESSQVIDNKTQDFSNLLAEQIGEMGSKLDNNAQNFSSLIAEGIGEISSKFDNKTENFSNLIAERIGEISSKFDNKTEDFSNLIAERIGEMSSKLDYKTAQFNNLLSERANELTGILDKQASPIVDNLENVSSNVSDRLTDIATAVGTNTASLLTNLDEATSKLQKLSDYAVENMADMRTNLISQSEQFSTIVQQSQDAMLTSSTLSENIYSKLEASSTSVLQGMQEVANRVETQGNNLHEAARLIEQTQSNLEATVDNKQATLQNLTHNISERGRELSDTIEGFSSVVNILVEQVADTSRTLSGSVSSDISSTISDATAQFELSVSSMRQVAMEMRAELEETRQQMRKGILELPEETAQSADAMRRVVTDQISALRDLTKIIEDSGNMLDAKSVKQPESVTPHSQPIPVTKASAPLPRPAPQTPRTQVTSVEPAAEAEVTRPFSPFSQTRNDIKPVSTPSVAPAQPISADVSATENGGWVSDLLRRASQEPVQNNGNAQKQTPSSNGVSLKNLSADIPNAIDNQVISDLWTRYRNGENNLFNRNLYNLNGQMLFDQITRNYGVNAEFKTGIDNYVADFESRLAQASAQGQDDHAIHAYLTSDQGKIYTMLAHVAGRYK